MKVASHFFPELDETATRWDGRWGKVSVSVDTGADGLLGRAKSRVEYGRFSTAFLLCSWLQKERKMHASVDRWLAIAVLPVA